MAGFCKQCSIDYFGEDCRDFANLITLEQAEQGLTVEVLCEGCGEYIQVDINGKKIGE